MTNYNFCTWANSQIHNISGIGARSLTNSEDINHQGISRRFKTKREIMYTYKTVLYAAQQCSKQMMCC